MVRTALRSISNVKFVARKSLFALAGLALWLAATHTVSAQGFDAGVGFQRTKFRPFSGEIKVVDNTKPGLKILATINVKPAMDQAAAKIAAGLSCQGAQDAQGIQPGRRLADL